MSRISSLVEAGADLADCMIVEIFAGTARVTAELKRFGLASAFVTEHIRHRQAAAQVVIADLTTDTGVGLLMQWLSHLAFSFAPPCGSASRARSIPLKRKLPGDPPAPQPLRSDRHPNGLPKLRFLDRIKVSKANKLYFLSWCVGLQPKDVFLHRESTV